MTEALPKRKARWYFGGLSAAAAAFFTHPLDLIKVVLQTQQHKTSVFEVTKKITAEHGFFSLYNGISASVLRQLTYSTARFGIYEAGKNYISTSTFAGKVELAIISGTVGGFIGAPFDLVNVRMQNDVKLPPEERRNYKNAVDGLFKVYKTEGIKNMFTGAELATVRGVLVTVGQIAFYDQVKSTLLETAYFEDDLKTYLVSSLAAAIISTTLTQPMDVLKTRAMNAKPGEYKNTMDIVLHTAKLGPLGFFKGYLPAFVRIGPHTILTFVILEQMTHHFGIF
ncbi:mitochondrial dicarboxylate carrier-like [Teleopsis dalmanni]|uniref:mitochondrial dicarboxylate carrier-like n=1 Tax=Teleopsis dalmanni TaxID=139649 RepID=UPI0018CFADE5|nr:mitochondrial dicarboxylate carrier-like [Teleopsis dalmanni]